MPQPAKILALPDDVRQELHVRVIRSGFSDYHGHSAWLKSQGHDISHTAVWAYFRAVKADVQRQLTALAVASQSVPLYAALAKETGEDFSLASEYMLQAATLAKLQEALAEGEIGLEDLAAFQELSRSQRLTRMRAATERLRAAQAKGAGDTARPDDPCAPAGRAAFDPRGEAIIRAIVEGGG